MNNKTIQADYWDKKIDIEVPQDTVLGEIPAPAIIQDPEKAVRDAIANPVGAPPLMELAKKACNGKVTIAFDDPSRPGKPRQLIIPIILETLLKAGVKEENITLLCGSGNHCKWTPMQLRAYLSPAIYDQFSPAGSASRVQNHDCHDQENLVNMGISTMGDYVEYNRALVDSDLFIYTGTVVVSNWGGMTGTGVIIGFPSTRSMTSTHGFPVVGHPDSCHGNQHTMMYRQHKQAVMDQIEKFTGKRVFYIDVVPSTGGAPAGVFAGYSPEINEPTWKFAESIYHMEVPQADVLVYGVPRYSLYGETSNPLIALAAACAPARMWTNKPLVREGGVIIALCHCDGTIDERSHPSYREILNLYKRCFSMEELSTFQEEFMYREDLIFKYRHAYAYAPVHGFWLMYESEYALNHTSKIIMAGVPGMDNPLAKVQISGTGGPGAARDVGCTPARDFADAMKIAEKIVGKNPRVLACPSFWSKIRPHFYVK